jgi:hypothetical protein
MTIRPTTADDPGSIPLAENNYDFQRMESEK